MFFPPGSGGLGGGSGGSGGLTRVTDASSPEMNRSINIGVFDLICINPSQGPVSETSSGMPVRWVGWAWTGGVMN